MVADSDLGALRSAVRGPVLTQHDPEFAEDASGYNAAVVHQPAVIVAATSAADVAATIGWAAEHRLPVAVQATGHGVTERMVDGVLINTRQMQDVQIRPDRRLARVAAGVKWKTLLSQTLPHGLVGLCGSSSDVGIVGFTLGGGLPLLGRALGFAADRVRSIEVVTPDAQIRTVDAEHEPELFEVLRGGKGNFGVVTALEFELTELSDFYGGGLIFPGTDADVVMTAFRGWLADLPDEACPSIALLRLPDVPFVPAPLRGQFVVHVRFAFAGSKEEGDRLLAPMRAVSQVIMDTAGPMSYEQIDLVNLDPPEPIPYQEAGALLTEIDDDAQAALLQVVGPGAQTPLLMVELRPMGGALARPSAGRDAVSGRDAGWSLLGIGVLVPPVAELVPAGITALLDAMRPWATGLTMVNFHGHAGDATDRARAWPPEIYETIKRAKRRYDPDNMMRFGHAVILPSGEPVDAAVPL
jgi:FAD/FMN-containing dehydrogenase